MRRIVLLFCVSGVLLFTVLLTITLRVGENVDTVRLAFTSNREGNTDIYFADIRRGLTVAMTNDRGTDNNSSFSYDGRWMLYFSQRSPGFYSVMNLDTLAVMDLPLVGSPNAPSVPEWVPGKVMIYFMIIPNGMHYFDPITGELSDTEDYDFSLSGVNTQALVPGMVLDGTFPFGPFRGINLDEDGFPRIVIVDEYDQLTRSSTVSLPPFALSPDEQYFAAALDLEGQFDIYLVPTSEGEAINVTNNPTLETRPIWSHDGRYIAFITTRDGNHEVYVYDMQTEAIFNVTRHPLTDGDPVWIP